MREKEFLFCRQQLVVRAENRAQCCRHLQGDQDEDRHPSVESSVGARVGNRKHGGVPHSGELQGRREGR